MEKPTTRKPAAMSLPDKGFIISGKDLKRIRDLAKRHGILRNLLRLKINVREADPEYGPLS